MSIIDKLASSLNRRDEIPNQELASLIITSKDKHAVQELVENLSSKKAVQNDCIKVLYEIGERAPGLIADHTKEFVLQLHSKNNRLQWGAMAALSAITNTQPEVIYDSLPVILQAADKGSVITKDHAINILIKLCQIEQYAENAFSLLIEQLQKSLPNQLPMYAERAVQIINNENKDLFVATLSSRLLDIEKDTKRRRLEKVIKKLGQSPA